MSDTPHPAKIVVFISGRGSNMKAIVEACRSGDIAGEVVAVLSNKDDAAGLVYAAHQGIDTHVIRHQDFDNRDDYDAALAAWAAGYAPDLICLAGFMRILGAGFVDAFSGKVLNIHPSLLPKYKGLNTHKRAIDAGDKVAGCSVHLVTAELDGGRVIAQCEVPIEANDTPDALAARVLGVEHRTYIDAINAFITEKDA